MQKLNKDRIRSLYWDEKCTVAEIANELKLPTWVLYDFMSKNNIPRRNYSEANFLVNESKPQFKVKKYITIAEKNLKIAGIMLYWAEGTFRGCTIDFANSNPNMVRLFLKFLRNVCGVDERRLRVYLYAYSYQKIKELKVYWYGVTGIPLNQFTKPYIRDGSVDVSNRKLPYGLVHVRYNDKKLLGVIKNWIEDYISECGEVPEWPNGPDCDERSVLKKFRMEKRVNSGEPLIQRA